MGGEDERDWVTAERYRRTWRQGDRPEGYTLHHHRREFAKAYAELASGGFRRNWHLRTVDKEARAKKPSSKTKFICARCELNAWAKPEALLICGDCGKPMRTEEPASLPRKKVVPYNRRGVPGHPPPCARRSSGAVIGPS